MVRPFCSENVQPAAQRKKTTYNRKYNGKKSLSVRVCASFQRERVSGAKESNEKKKLYKKNTIEWRKTINLDKRIRNEGNKKEKIKIKKRREKNACNNAVCATVLQKCVNANDVGMENINVPH